ncbi:MAG: transposase [Moraxellaceae bacterium]|nr:transposase [Moraxellaceae bacterium]
MVWPVFRRLRQWVVLHTAIVTGGGFESMELEAFKWVNTLIGNVKNSIKGAYHAINKKHLPRYLAEFCYRFNRRFRLEDMLVRFIYIASRTTPIPIRLLKIAEAYG